MEKPKMYFSDFRTVAFGDGLPAKPEKLLHVACAWGNGFIDHRYELIAVK